jgi:hypothetical protein
LDKSTYGIDAQSNPRVRMYIIDKKSNCRRRERKFEVKTGFEKGKCEG